MPTSAARNLLRPTKDSASWILQAHISALCKDLKIKRKENTKNNNLIPYFVLCERFSKLLGGSAIAMLINGNTSSSEHMEIKRVVSSQQSCILFEVVHIYRTGLHQMEDLEEEKNYTPANSRKITGLFVLHQHPKNMVMGKRTSIVTDSPMVKWPKTPIIKNTLPW